MLLSQFAHGRSQLPFFTSNLTVSSGGNTTAVHTLYLSIQGENPVGVNLPSALVPVTVAAGQKLTVTLPQSGEGEYWTAFILSGSTMNDPSTLEVLARASTTDALGVAVAQPIALNLTADEHFQLGAIVSSPSILPTTNLLPGMRRAVTTTTYLYEYDPYSDLPIDPQDPSILAATVGQWLRVPTFSRFITETDQAGGCAQDIRGINPALVKTPIYACNGLNGTARHFWLNNVGAEAIPSGQRVMMSITMSGIPRSALFDGLLRCVFRGYVNTVTGAIRTTTADGTPFVGVGDEILFENRKTDLIFQDDLQAGEAYALTIYPNLLPDYLNYGVVDNSVISVLPSIASQASAFCEAGDALGDQIYPVYDRGVCVPIRGAAVRCLKRSGLVNSRSFLASPASTVGGFTANTTGQQVRINDSGEVYRGSGELLSVEQIRAIVSCEAGVSVPCALSGAVNLAGGTGARITLTYPSNGSYATIRGDYPDPFLAGLIGKAQLNMPLVTVYVVSGGSGTIRRFKDLLLADGATQAIDIPDLFTGEVISQIPGATAADYCLFAPVSATISANGVGSFPADSYQVSYAFQGDGSTVTRISHSTAEGCIPTKTLTISEVEDTASVWAADVADLAAFRAVPVPKLRNCQARTVANLGGRQVPYQYNAALVATDNGTSTSASVKPNGIPTGAAGAWVPMLAGGGGGGSANTFSVWRVTA
jgi:hypothetical protein